jgi:tRNA pseudouridine38-40 synthase
VNRRDAQTESSGLRTFKMVLEYDGTDFAGWQVQPDARTVQGELEKAVNILTRETVRLTGAGRTDAGVHALGQVASFETNCGLSASEMKRAMNAVLPRDVRVRELENPTAPFDARRDAKMRTYRYVLARRPLAVGRQYAWHPRMRFELDSMMRASEFLVGEHRWDAFCRKDPDESRYESRVRSVRWETDADTVAFEISAVRFFHNMVRILVGTLLDVGRGKRTPEQFRDVLESRDRTRAGFTAPPQGLFLVKVEY